MRLHSVALGTGLLGATAVTAAKNGLPVDKIYGAACRTMDAARRMGKQNGRRTGLVKKLGQEKADQVFEEHWATWFTEKDVDEIVAAGLNSVRIPLGYWIVEPLVERSTEFYVSGNRIDIRLALMVSPSLEVTEKNYKRALIWAGVMTALSHIDPDFSSVFAIEAINEPIMDANQTPGYGDFVRMVEYAIGIKCDGTDYTKLFTNGSYSDSLDLGFLKVATHTTDTVLVEVLKDIAAAVKSICVDLQLSLSPNLRRSLDANLGVGLSSVDLAQIKQGHGAGRGAMGASGPVVVKRSEDVEDLDTRVAHGSSFERHNSRKRLHHGRGISATLGKNVGSRIWAGNTTIHRMCIDTLLEPLTEDNTSNPADAAIGPQLYDAHLYFSFGGVADPNAESYMRVICNTDRVAKAVEVDNSPIVFGEWSLATNFADTEEFLRDWSDAQRLIYAGQGDGWYFWNFKVEENTVYVPYWLVTLAKTLASYPIQMCASLGLRIAPRPRLELWIENIYGLSYRPRTIWDSPYGTKGQSVYMIDASMNTSSMASWNRLPMRLICRRLPCRTNRMYQAFDSSRTHVSDANLRPSIDSTREAIEVSVLYSITWYRGESFYEISRTSSISVVDLWLGFKIRSFSLVHLFLGTGLLGATAISAAKGLPVDKVYGVNVGLGVFLFCDMLIDSRGCFQRNGSRRWVVSPATTALNVQPASCKCIVNVISGRAELQYSDLVKKLGQTRADKVFAESTWFTQKDVDDIAAAGLNTVRIPIGYWIIEDLVDRKTEFYPKGGLEFLKNGLRMLKEKGIHVMLDFHAMPGVSSANQMFAGRCTSDVRFYVCPINLENNIAYADHPVMTEMVYRDPDFSTVFAIEAINEPIMDASKTPGYGNCAGKFGVSCPGVDRGRIVSDPLSLAADKVVVRVLEKAISILNKTADKPGLELLYPSTHINSTLNLGGVEISAIRQGHGAGRLPLPMSAVTQSIPVKRSIDDHIVPRELGSEQYNTRRRQPPKRTGPGTVRKVADRTYLAHEFLTRYSRNPTTAANGPQLYDAHLYFSFGGVADPNPDSYMQTICTIIRWSLANGHLRQTLTPLKILFAIVSLICTMPVSISPRITDDAQGRTLRDISTPAKLTVGSFGATRLSKAGYFKKDPSRLADPNVCKPWIANRTLTTV
ncbi:glycoside hydrolase family 5 protein [Rhizoctonia solani AG-1 IA]|uniref:Glycoside hydrolase family 5 protein n=1 Tax=Thanatephorus cucumeris (strain AG1-IA) TaxID=983506 RepID=L8WMW1_THACA|nr:glycoside hydrolase family 5 protein [Rhizoctonia solani AG-1 IA]